MTNLFVMSKSRVISMKTAQAQSRKMYPTKTPADQSKEIENLREKCIQSKDFSDVTNNQLVNLQRNTTKYVKILISQRKYQQARQYQLLSQSIGEEAALRMSDPSRAPQQKPRVSQRSMTSMDRRMEDFDKETERQVEILKQRHQQILMNFTELWKNQIQQRYLQDSAKLTQMKRDYREARRTGRVEDAQELEEQIDNLAEEEYNANMEQYHKDYDKAEQQLLEKQEIEIQRLINERKKVQRATMPKQKIVVPKRELSLNLAKSSLTNRSSLSSSYKAAIVTPDLQNNKSKSTPLNSGRTAPVKRATLTTKSRERTIKQKSEEEEKKENTRPEVACQCEFGDDSNGEDDSDMYFDDPENEGVLTQEEITAIETEGEKAQEICDILLQGAINDTINKVIIKKPTIKSKDSETFRLDNPVETSPKPTPSKEKEPQEQTSSLILGEKATSKEKTKDVQKESSEKAKKQSDSFFDDSFNDEKEFSAIENGSSKMKSNDEKSFDSSMFSDEKKKNETDSKDDDFDSDFDSDDEIRKDKNPEEEDLAPVFMVNNPYSGALLGMRRRGMSSYALDVVDTLEDEDDLLYVASREVEAMVSDIIEDIHIREVLLDKVTRGIMSECLRTCIVNKDE